MRYLRRISDKRGMLMERRARDVLPEKNIRSMPWEDQRTQFLTRFLFWVMYVAYFNLGDVAKEMGPDLLIVNLVAVAYPLITLAYLVHAWQNNHSPFRWRLAMWTDLLMVSFAVLADGRIMSPTYLAYIMVILGNGMRYGLRLFAEAVIATFVLVSLIMLFRFTQYLPSVTVSTAIFLAFFGIIILYSYSLMTRIEKARWKLEKESNLDHLTGLLNRRGLYEKSNRLFRSLDLERHEVAVLFADLDGFKAINDTLGHPAGDKVLREVARMAGEAMRSSDIAARFGGDEFLIVLPNCSLDNAMSVAGRLQRAVSEWADKAGITLSISIGLGQAPQHGRDLDSVLAQVDSAMYRGKLSFGKGGIQLADAMGTA